MLNLLPAKTTPVFGENPEQGVLASVNDTALQRKTHLCIPFLGIARPLSPNFHTHVSMCL